jgi:nitrous oxidase accessory protein NosD
MAFDVGPDREIETIGEALERSVDGDTIRVHAGVYEERVVIRAAVALLGIGDPIIDGGGTGTVSWFSPPTASALRTTGLRTYSSAST